MPVPTTYTESTLRQYLVRVLGEVGTILTWTETTPQIDEAVTDAVFTYGTTDLTTVTSVTALAKLRAIAAVMAWRAAVRSLAARYDVRADTFDNKRSQAHKMALENLAAAESVAAEWGAAIGARVRVQSIVYVDDPYAALSEEFQTVLP